jgi:hypothetical protein
MRRLPAGPSLGNAFASPRELGRTAGSRRSVSSRITRHPQVGRFGVKLTRDARSLSEVPGEKDCGKPLKPPAGHFSIRPVEGTISPVPPVRHPTSIVRNLEILFILWHFRNARSAVSGPSWQGLLRPGVSEDPSRSSQGLNRSCRRAWGAPMPHDRSSSAARQLPRCLVQPHVPDPKRCC